MLIRSILFWLYFIQLKSYRFDRIWRDIKQRAFWRLIFSKHHLLLGLPLLAIVVYGFVAILLFGGGIPPVPVFIFIYLLQFYIVFYALQSIKSFLAHSLKLPKITSKILVIFVAVLTIEFAPLFHYDTMVIFFAIGFEIIQPFIVLGIFALTYAPNIFLHRYFINRAKIKIQAHKNLIVIGITGSYGKTSTKEFLAHILSKKYKVLKTPAHINVDTGVAKTILRKLKPEHEIFIVEMGAYRKGEIRKICNLAKPQYAIITGLSNQHLELFGSLKAIAEAKFELIEAISDQNGVLSNAESKPLIIEFGRRGWKPLWYGASERSQLKARYIAFTENGTEFQINNTPFRTLLIGSAALNNLLGAITMAQMLGMDLGDISRAVSDIPFVPHTMEPRINSKGALIIDDTYNANTEGVITALNDLKYFNQPSKIFVFGEIIELGEKTKNDHIQIAKTIARTTNCVLLLPGRMRQVMYDTLIAEGYDKSRILDKHDRARLKDIINSDTVVLFEGRGFPLLSNGQSVA